MLQIPIQPVPSQQLQVTLGGQNLQIAVYQKDANVYVDLNLGGVDISSGILALNGVALCPFDYEGLVGNFSFIDLQGTSDPDYTGFGTRFVLLYITAADLG